MFIDRYQEGDSEASVDNGPQSSTVIWPPNGSRITRQAAAGNHLGCFRLCLPAMDQLSLLK